MSVESAGLVVLGIIILNAVATVWLYRLDIYDRIQFRNQLLLIWLLPIVGVILIYSVGRSASSQNAGSPDGNIHVPLDDVHLMDSVDSLDD